MSSHFAESTVEDAALQWFGELGFAAKLGPEIAPGEIQAERAGFRLCLTSARHVGETVLAERLRNALAALNPNIPRHSTMLSARSRPRIIRR